MAVCDVDSTRRAAGKKRIDTAYGNGDCKTYNDYREILCRLFNWSMEEGAVRMPADKNPVAKVGRYKEHAPEIRAELCEGLEFLGVELDPARNRNSGNGDAVVSVAGSSAAVVVVHTNEELVVARETVRALGGNRKLLTTAAAKEDSA